MSTEAHIATHVLNKLSVRKHDEIIEHVVNAYVCQLHTNTAPVSFNSLSK